MNTKPENWKKLANVGYRHAMATAQFKRLVPFQISALRKERDWSQEILAEKSGLTQGVISRAEDPDYGNLAVNTLLKIANGLDVVFVGMFMSYSEYDRWRAELSENMAVPDYETENERFASREIIAGLFGSHEGENKSSLALPDNDRQAIQNVIYIDAARQNEQRPGLLTSHGFAAAAGAH